MRDRWSLDTKVVHLPGEREEKSLSPPIYQASTFPLRDAEEGARMASSIHPERYYTRWGNPTVKLLEEAMREIEEGDSSLSTSSGMAAIHVALLTALKDRKHVVASKVLYSATHELLTRVLPNLGIRVTFVDLNDIDKLSESVSRDTGAVYFETPANPTLDVIDIEGVADVVREKGCEVIVDNTFATPYNQLPLKLGATVVIHSSTKYLSGHFDVTGGIIVSCSKRFVEEAWKILKLVGPSASPFDAWLTLRGLRTFSLRMRRHNDNALKVASFLSKHHSVSKVMYPGLESHPRYKVATKQMRGFGGMVSFTVVGGYRMAKRLVESLSLCRLAVSLGGVQTLVEHPASMSHAPLTDKERKEMGIEEGLVRMSVGIEDPNDIIEDLRVALESVSS